MSSEIEIVEEKVVASVTYSIKNTGECTVDIDLDEMNEAIVELFANLYFGILSHKFSEVTLALIEEGMEESENSKLYEYFCKKLQAVARVEMKSILDNDEDKPKKRRKESEEPCISPTDFLTGG